MIKLYDTVRIKSSGELASVIEIDDNDGKDVPIYLCELHNKPAGADVTDVVKWLESNEIEPVDAES